MANFIVQFPLQTERYQEDILDKRFEIGRQIYNSLVNVTQKRYKEMIKTKQYRTLLSSLTGDKKTDKLVWKQIDGIRKEFNFSEYDFYKDAKFMQHHYKKNLDSKTVECIARNVWKSYEKFFYGNGSKVYYKRHGELNSLEGKSNKTGIRFKDDMIFWNGLKIPVVIDYNNSYERQAMQSEIRYNRIVRKYVRNKYKYYVQIVFKGNPPIRHSIGDGDVGLCISTSAISISSQSDVKLLELADRVKNIEVQKGELYRKMDRSRRSTNPDNYNKDGTIKKQGNKKVQWNKSNHYVRYQNELKELYRKQADIRKYQHECLANYIISLGDKIYVEKIQFSELQKQQGKILENKAPSMLLEIINRKLKYFEKELIKIENFELQGFNKTDTKELLSKEWIDLDGMKVHKDMYRAFLIMNMNSDLKSFDVDKCNERFDNFYRLYNLEINKLI